MSLFIKKKNSNEKPLSFQERREQIVKQEEEVVRRDIERKIKIEKNKKKVFFGLLIGGLVLLIIIVSLVLLPVIRDKFFKEEEVIPEPIVDNPPDNFQVVAAEVYLLQADQLGGQYDVLAKIQNTDPDWGVPILNYEIKLLDAYGEEVASRKRSAYILPQEEKTIVEIGIDTTKQAVEAEVSLEIEKVQKLKNYNRPEIKLTNIYHTTQNAKSKVIGTLYNASPLSFDNVDINIIIYNTNNEPIAVNYTNIRGFVSESGRDFTASWRDLLNESEISRIVAESYVNLFESSTFMNTYGAGSPKQF